MSEWDIANPQHTAPESLMYYYIESSLGPANLGNRRVSTSSLFDTMNRKSFCHEGCPAVFCAPNNDAQRQDAGHNGGDLRDEV